MKKRMLGTFLAVLMMAALALSGCGASDSGESTEAAETTAETTAEVTEALEETEAVTEAATTEAATETEESTVVLDVDGDGTVINFGDNQNSAAEMPMNTKLYGSLGDGYYWFSFTTDSDANADNRVTLINKTSTTGHVYANVYDEYGTELASGDANDSGTASTFSMGELTTGCVYYIRISTQYDNEADYTFTIREPEVPIEETAEVVNEGATAAIIEEETAGIVEDVETAAIIEE